MTKDGEDLPRWVQRRDGRRASRYHGNKVVRWIARPTLKERADGAENSPAAPPERYRSSGYGMLRLVADS